MRTMTDENDENDDLDMFLHYSRRHCLGVSVEISADACLFCPKLVFHNVDSGPGLHWLVGSPSFPPVTNVSSLKCIHAFAPSDPASPDLPKESDIEKAFSCATEAVIAKFRDPQTVYMLDQLHSPNQSCGKIFAETEGRRRERSVHGV